MCAFMNICAKKFDMHSAQDLQAVTQILEKVSYQDHLTNRSCIEYLQFYWHPTLPKVKQLQAAAQETPPNLQEIEATSSEIGKSCCSAAACVLLRGMCADHVLIHPIVLLCSIFRNIEISHIFRNVLRCIQTICNSGRKDGKFKKFTTHRISIWHHTYAIISIISRSIIISPKSNAYKYKDVILACMTE